MATLVKGAGHAKRVRRLPERVARASIWAPGAIPVHERKWAVPLKRVALPVYDVLLVIAGYVGIHSGIPSLDRLLPPPVSITLAIILAVAAGAALLGIAFPRFWKLETAAKVAVIGLLGLYFAAVVTVGGANREFVAVIVLLALPLPFLRLWILGIENRDRRAKEESPS